MGTKFQGNSNLRVTVNRPNTLQALQSAATHHFGHNGPLSLWHHGKNQVHSHHHVNNILHDDVVVVTWGNQKPPEGFKLITTNQSDFVQHPIEKQLVPITPRTPAKVPFEGKTSYNTDFVPHPTSVEDMKPPPSKWQPTATPTGSTTYNSHFVKHAPQDPTLPLIPNTPRAVLPFEGKSSYTRDFIKHPVKPPLTPGKPKEFRQPDAPFEGVTTYAGDFNPKPIRPRSAIRPQHPPPTGLPFVDNTEYRQEYVKKKQDRHLVHLEPAHHLTTS